MTRVAIAGTDTGVGKTTVAAAVAASLRSRGIHTNVLKPVETGGTRGDACVLRAASGSGQSLDDICPSHFDSPISPLAAAIETGVAISIPDLDRAFERASGDNDALIVEGAGGLLVPLTRTMSFADLFARWRLPVILIAPNRLGVLNHTLLSVEAAAGRGIRVLAIVLNEGVGTADQSSSSNLAMLKILLPDTLCLSFPRLRDASDISDLGRHSEECGLTELILRDDTGNR